MVILFTYKIGCVLDMDDKMRFGWYPFKELGFLIYKEAERCRQKSVSFFLYT